MDTRDATYDDGAIRCDDDGITVRWYYPWGSRQIPYSSIRGVRPFQLSPLRGKWRIWGSGDLRHWFNLDLGRPRKGMGIELDCGVWVLPCITPDDPERVLSILDGRVGG